MEMTKNKLVSCYQLIEEKDYDIDKLKKYLDNNKYLEFEKEYSKYNTITIRIYKTWFKKYQFNVYKYGEKSFTKSFINLKDLVEFSKNFTKEYFIDGSSCFSLLNGFKYRVETISNYRKRKALELKELELEKKELEIKKEKMKEFENIL
jgi:hypothetical protein